MASRRVSRASSTRSVTQSQKSPSPKKPAQKKNKNLEELKRLYKESPLHVKHIFEACGTPISQQLLHNMMHVSMEELLSLNSELELKDVGHMYRARERESVFHCIQFVREEQKKARSMLFGDVFGVPEAANAFGEVTLRHIANMDHGRIKDTVGEMLGEKKLQRLFQLFMFLQAASVEDQAVAEALAYKAKNAEWDATGLLDKTHDPHNILNPSAMVSDGEFKLTGYTPLVRVETPSAGHKLTHSMSVPASFLDGLAASRSLTDLRPRAKSLFRAGSTRTVGTPSPRGPQSARGARKPVTRANTSPNLPRSGSNPSLSNKKSPRSSQHTSHDSTGSMTSDYSEPERQQDQPARRPRSRTIGTKSTPGKPPTAQRESRKLKHTAAADGPDSASHAATKVPTITIDDDEAPPLPHLSDEVLQKAAQSAAASKAAEARAAVNGGLALDGIDVLVGTESEPGGTADADEDEEAADKTEPSRTNEKPTAEETAEKTNAPSSGPSSGPITPKAKKSRAAASNDKLSKSSSSTSTSDISKGDKKLEKTGSRSRAMTVGERSDKLTRRTSMANKQRTATKRPTEQDDKAASSSTSVDKLPASGSSTSRSHKARPTSATRSRSKTLTNAAAPAKDTAVQRSPRPTSGAASAVPATAATRRKSFRGGAEVKDTKERRESLITKTPSERLLAKKKDANDKDTSAEAKSTAVTRARSKSTLLSSAPGTSSSAKGSGRASVGSRREDRSDIQEQLNKALDTMASQQATIASLTGLLARTDTSKESTAAPGPQDAAEDAASSSGVALRKAQEEIAQLRQQVRAEERRADSAEAALQQAKDKLVDQEMAAEQDKLTLELELDALKQKQAQQEADRKRREGENALNTGGNSDLWRSAAQAWREELLDLQRDVKEELQERDDYVAKVQRWLGSLRGDGEHRAVAQEEAQKEIEKLLPFLGISLLDAPLPADVKENSGDGHAFPRGVSVSSVQPMSAAEEAGLQDDDVIEYINGVAVDSLQDALKMLTSMKPSQKIRFHVRRNSDTNSGSVRLAISFSIGVKKQQSSLTVDEVRSLLRVARWQIEEADLEDDYGTDDDDEDDADGDGGDGHKKARAKPADPGVVMTGDAVLRHLASATSANSSLSNSYEEQGGLQEVGSDLDEMFGDDAEQES